MLRILAGTELPQEEICPDTIRYPKDRNALLFVKEVFRVAEKL